MNNTKGTKVVITDCLCGHHFRIGQKVKIIRVDEEDDDYMAKGYNGKIWCITDEECEAITK